MENLIKELEKIQVKMLTERRDYHGVVPYDKHDDIDAIQTVINILQNLIIEPNYIWKKPKN